MDKKPILNVMIDIETLSTDREHGLILSVGMRTFSFEENRGYDIPEDSQCWNIDVLSSILAGRVADDSTIKWWQARTDEQKEELVKPGTTRMLFKEAMQDIYDILAGLANSFELMVWSKGTDFDFPMLESSWKDAGVVKSNDDIPYKFWNKRDVRTFVGFAKLACPDVDFSRPTSVAHSALKDCDDQIGELQFAFDVIKKNKAHERVASEESAQASV